MKYAQVKDGIVTNVIDTPFKGYIETDADPAKGWLYDGADFAPPTPPPAPPIEAGNVNAERDRRIYAPATVYVTGIGAIRVDMTPQSQTNILGLVTISNMRLAGGDNTTPTAFTDATNVEHQMVPAQLVQMGTSVLASVSALYAKAKLLKAMDPIPADYYDDKYWV